MFSELVAEYIFRLCICARVGLGSGETAEMGLWKNFRPNRNPQHTFLKQNPNKTSLDSWPDLISSPASFMKAGELVTQSMAACRAVLHP